MPLAEYAYAVDAVDESGAAVCHARRPAGSGRVDFARVAGRTAVVSRFASSPLKLLTPGGPAGVATVVASTYGGGLLAGDRVALDVRCGAGTRCALGTQASTKVYRRRGAAGETPAGAARQSVVAEVGPDAALVVAPDPVTCFAGAAFEQVQRFDLAATGSLLLVDWLTSGRAACGERWAFERYRTETVIAVAGERVARDALLLDPLDGPVGAPHRMGRFDCLASVYLVGPLFADAAAQLLARVGAMPVRRRDDLVVAAGPLADRGALLRVVGGGAEQVGRVLRAELAGAFDAFGTDPWSIRF